MPRRDAYLFWALGCFVGIACSGDDPPIAHSQPVGISLKAKADDVKAGVITEEKNINTESGNPYGAFVAAAKAHLGRDPGRIALADLTLLLGGTSQGVTALEQVLAGRVDVLFVTNDTNNTYAAAHFLDPTGSGAVQGKLDFDPAATEGGPDRVKFLDGGFKVVLRGGAAAGFEGRKDAEADLQLTFGFEAFE